MSAAPKLSIALTVEQWAVIQEAAHAGRIELGARGLYGPARELASLCAAISKARTTGDNYVS